MTMMMMIYSRQPKRTMTHLIRLLITITTTTKLKKNQHKMTRIVCSIKDLQQLRKRRKRLLLLAAVRFHPTG